VQVADAHANQPTRGHGLFADHRHRAGRVISHVRATDPSAVAANPPIPRKPTTSISAPDPLPVTARAA
jgi:hypothetical protein